MEVAVCGGSSIPIAFDRFLGAFPGSRVGKKLGSGGMQSAAGLVPVVFSGPSIVQDSEEMCPVGCLGSVGALGRLCLGLANFWPSRAPRAARVKEVEPGGGSLCLPRGFLILAFLIVAC